MHGVHNWLEPDDVQRVDLDELYQLRSRSVCDVYGNFCVHDECSRLVFDVDGCVGVNEQHRVRSGSVCDLHGNSVVHGMYNRLVQVDA